MTTTQIVIAVLVSLFVILPVMLLLNPPAAWLNKIKSGKDKP